MSTLRRLWNVFRHTRMDDELRQEIETHLALIEEDERAQGSSAEQARTDARARFGNPLAYRERALEAVTATWLEQAGKEVVFAARRLLRSPAFTIAAVLTLALAIGANASIFAVVERVVLNPLPYPDSDRVIELDHGSQRLNIPAGFGLTLGLYYQYSERSHTLRSVAIYQTDDATLTGDGEPERIRVTRVSPSLVSVTGVAPVLGRWFTDAEGAPGATQVGVLSNGLWMRRYSSNPGIVGRSVLLGGVPIRIIGVMPPSFAFPDSRVDLWIPAQVARAMGFGLWSYQGIARLREGATITDARHELASLIADVPRAFPGDLYALGNVQTNLIVSARTLKEAIVGRVARALWILLAAVGLVLLIACANVTNLFLARSEVRQREVAIRRALGAGPLGIARFFLAESVLLSMTGGVLGVALASGAVRLLVRFGPATLPRLNEIRLDGMSVAYAIVLSTLAGLIFGVIAVWRSSSMAPALHDSGRASTASCGRHRARQLLMGAQVALALVLLIASGLMVRSFQNLRALDPGFDARSALTFSIGLPDRDYPNREEAVAAHQAILDGLSTLPGVRAASASTCLPLAGGCFGNTVRVRGRVLPPGAIPPVALFRAVAGGYFEVMGMRILRGRGIERQDVERHLPIVVVDQALVDQFFPNQNPIGEHVASNRAPRRPGAQPDLAWLEIVGVVSTTPTRTLIDPNPLPQLYMPMSIAAGPGIPTSALIGPNIAVMSYVVRSSTSATALLPAARYVVGTVDAKLALAQIRSLQDILDRSSAQMAFTMVLLAISAIVALLLGIIGIYGVMSYFVTQRTGEIGVRLALGAEPHSVARMIVRQGGLVALVGSAVGLAAAFTGSRVIDSLLYGVNARDPAVFAGTTVTLLGVERVQACGATRFGCKQRETWKQFVHAIDLITGVTMPDWRECLRSRLGALKLSPARQAEIVEELSQHLDDRYQDSDRRGSRALAAAVDCRGALRSQPAVGRGDRPRLRVVYLPLAQNHETGMTLYVRASVPPASLVSSVRREIQGLEPNLPVPNIQTVTETIETSLYAARMGAWLLAVFGGLAVLLAAVRIYGVLSFSISRRTHEMGIRLALGAGTHQVFLLIVRDGMLLVAAGLVIGLIGGLAGARSLASFLYGVSPSDIATFAAMTIVLTFIALVACVIPARRAMRVNPITALRYE